MVYRPSMLVTTPVPVSFTITVTPGIGFPSSALMILPVTVLTWAEAKPMHNAAVIANSNTYFLIGNFFRLFTDRVHARL
jgi:hypothetical protein